MPNPLSALRELRGPLAILATMLFVSQLGIAVMLPIIPLYAITLGAAPRDLGLLTTAFSVANVASQLGTGFILDRVDTRHPVRAGIAVYAGANVLIATATTVGSLAAFRGLAGLGAGANLVADRVYLSKIADPARLAYLNGILASAGSAGQVMGPAVGGILAELADLRAPFLVVAATSAVAFAAALTLPKAQERAAGPAADGAMASALNRSVVVLLVANTLLFTSFGGFITTFAPYTTTQLGWSTLEAGLVFTVFAAGSIVLAPPLAALADRRGRRLVATFVTLPLFLFGIVLFLGLPRPVIYAVTFFAGGGLSTFTACWFALLTEASPAARRGRTFGIVNAISTLGVVLGAMGSAAVWEGASVALALLLVGVVGGSSGLTLLLLPRRGLSPAA